MNKRRLLKLAGLLEADAANKKGVKFDLRTVVTPSPKLPEDATTVPISCGTQACAMGLAALSGAFKHCGLSYRIQRVDGIDERHLYIETTMHGEDAEYDEAAMDLFDITMDEANFLFTPAYYPSKAPRTGARGERLVAQRIRDFAAGKANPKAS